MTEPITSVRNPKIQWVRSLQARARNRRQEGFFVIEGVRLAEEALAAGTVPRMVLYEDELSARGQAVVRGYGEVGAEIFQVAPHVMAAAGDTQTSQGILAVLPIQPRPVPADMDLCLVLDGLRDPGNLGSILRTAAAGGVDAVFLAPGGVDPYAPKVVRAAMGAHFRLSVSPLGYDQISAHLAGLQVYLAAAGAGKPYLEVDLRAPVALVLGGEAQGASGAAENLAETPIHIPMPGGGESLNVATAAAILVFETLRQRTQTH